MSRSRINVIVRIGQGELTFFFSLTFTELFQKQLQQRWGMTPLFLLSTISITSQATVKCVLV